MPSACGVAPEESAARLGLTSEQVQLLLSSLVSKVIGKSPYVFGFCLPLSDMSCRACGAKQVGCGAACLPPTSLGAACLLLPGGACPLGLLPAGAAVGFTVLKLSFFLCVSSYSFPGSSDKYWCCVLRCHLFVSGNKFQALVTQQTYEGAELVCALRADARF